MLTAPRTRCQRLGPLLARYSVLADRSTFCCDIAGSGVGVSVFLRQPHGFEGLSGVPVCAELADQALLVFGDVGDRCVDVDLARIATSRHASDHQNRVAEVTVLQGYDRQVPEGVPLPPELTQAFVSADQGLIALELSANGQELFTVRMEDVYIGLHASLIPCLNG